MYPTLSQSLNLAISRDKTRRQIRLVRALFAVVAVLLFTATTAKAGAFSEAGTQLNLDLNTNNEVVAIVSNGSTYTLTLFDKVTTLGGTWSGLDSANVTGNGTATLTVTAAGLAAFDTLNVTDSAVNTSVIFADSGANTYGDTFNITIDNTAGSIEFSGASLFSGNAGITARTSRNIVLNGILKTVNGDLILEANQQAIATSGEFIGISIDPGSVVEATGTGIVTVLGRGSSFASNFRSGVALSSGAVIRGGTSGTLTVNGTGGTTSGSVGVSVAFGTITSNGANVSVTGLGRGSFGTTENHGVLVSNGLISAGGTGTVTVNGTGGAAASSTNYGVFVTAPSTQAIGITSSGGNVNVTGQGGGIGTGNNNIGVHVADFGGISAGGLGTVTVVGTGGATLGSFNHGVRLGILSGGLSTSRITSSGGAVSVTGQGGGAGNGNSDIGVFVTDSAIISAGGTGSVTVTGSGGNSSGGADYGVFVSQPGSQITSGGGTVSVTGTGTANSEAVVLGSNGSITTGTTAAPILVTADSVNTSDNLSAISSTGPVTIQPRTAGTLINLGGADVLSASPLTLGLSNLDLEGIRSSNLDPFNLTIGNSTSGQLTVSANITRLFTTNLGLVSGGDVVISGAQVNTTGGTLLLDPGVSPAAVKPTRGGTDATVSTVSFGSDLSINIAGTTVDTQYTQLNVAGTVNLSGVALKLTGAFVPTTDDVFTVVSANSVTGTFTGLAEGATVVFNTRTLRINYSATSVTLTDVTAPNTDLTITKTDGATTAILGGATVYTITATNVGPNPANAATLADTFPAACTAVTWTCVGAGGGTCTASGSGDLNDTVNLPSGGSVTYTANCSISPTASGSLVNTATITAPGTVTDPNPGNNSATDTDSYVASADLGITKTDGVSSATPGGSTTYTIVASNSGPSNVAIATVADTFPPACISVSYTSVATGGAGGNSASGLGNIRDAALTLQVGSSVTYTALCTLSQTATGSLVNTATVSSATPDPVPGNNSATDSDTLVALTLPLAVNDSVLAVINTPLLIDVLDNDQPFSNFNQATINVKRPYRRGIHARREGHVQFTPRPNNTSPEAFNYTVGDANGTLSNIATVNVNFDEAPAVSAIVPGNAVTNIATRANIVVTFNEAVAVNGNWFQIACSLSGVHSAVVSGGPTGFILNPAGNFDNGETCTVTVKATQASDQDTIDPPNTMTTNFISTFTITP